MDSVFEIETIPIKNRQLNAAAELISINNDIAERLITILYDKDDEGRKTKVKSISPLYDEDNEITDVLVLYEEETQVGVIFNDINDTEVIFYPKEYLDIFKEDNLIIVEHKKYRIKNISYDLDSIYLLLIIDLDII